MRATLRARRSVGTGFVEKLNHLKITLVFIITIIIPSIVLSAFAYEAMEGERAARNAERKRRLHDEARSLAREVDDGLRVPSRNTREACVRLCARLRQPQDAAFLLESLVDVSAAASLSIFAADGERVFPVSGAQDASIGPVGSLYPDAEVGLLLQEAAALTSQSAGQREGAITRLHALKTSGGRAVAARLEIARLLAGKKRVAGSDDAVPTSPQGDDVTLGVVMNDVLAPVLEAPIELLDPLGRPVAAQVRLEYAKLAARLGQKRLYRETLCTLARDLERDSALLPVDLVVDLAAQTALLLAAEGKPWDTASHHLLDAVSSRRKLEAWNEREDEVFGPAIRDLLRTAAARSGSTRPGDPPAGGAGGGSADARPRSSDGTDGSGEGTSSLVAGYDPLFMRPQATPAAEQEDSDSSRWFLRHGDFETGYEFLLLAPFERADGSLLGLASFSLDLEGFARKLVAERALAHADEGDVAFELVRGPGPSQDVAERQDAEAASPLGYPLDHLRVVARAKDQGADLLAREDTTMRLWLLALSVVGILAGAVVTTRTVLRERKAAELKSDFVTNVTHELRTPLTSIRMFIETLELGRVDDEAEAKECLGIMARETDRLTRLIERLLSFSKIESRKWRFRFTYVTPLELVNEALRLLRQQLNLKENVPLPIEVEFVQEVAPIAVDKDAIVEVLLNLLTNAWKYSPAEGRAIRILVTERRRQVVIDVEDNGIGVPRRDRWRIWKKFERGSNAEKHRIEGSGIGLTLALSIAKGHGGTISLTPLKQGSRFSLFLPKV